MLRRDLDPGQQPAGRLGRLIKDLTLMKHDNRHARDISVVVADDHDVVRLGLRELLGSQKGFVLLGEASSGREAVALTKRFRPNVVVMDLAMPLLNGMEATRQIVHACPEVRVIALSCYDDQQYVSQALAAGVMAYVLKGASTKDLIAAIHEVHEGRRFFSPAIIEQIGVWKFKFDEPTTCARAGAELSNRETEVLRLLGKGFRDAQIALKLGLSRMDAANLRQKLMRKLGLYSQKVVLF